ncbi:MAG: hypothetical protein ACPGU1_06145 [Myxococcota bacterium]
MTALTALAVTLAAAQMVTAQPAPDLATLETCEDSLDIAIFVTPRYAHRKAPMRALVVSDAPLSEVSILALAPDGTQSELPMRAFGGPPYGWVGTVEKPERGKWRIAVHTDQGIVACQNTRVRPNPYGNNELEAEVDPIWKASIKWERDTENLFSLWVEYLFYAPPEEELSWRPLHEVLRDSSRNLLYNHLNLREDSAGKRGLRLKPDCADLSYTLRAYFAWKMRLPFAVRGCTRGSSKRAPRCGDISTNRILAEEHGRVKAFERYARKRVAGTVHSSSGRTLPEDEKSNFYPVALTRQGLRPGTTYFDPYGHAMTIASWFPPSGDKAGVLVAVDAQPDGTIGRRIFWRGSFLFPEDGTLNGAGFKRFRPVVFNRRTGVARELSNKEIQASVDYGDVSLEQWQVGKDGFYEAMDALITPNPLQPSKALIAQIDALEQQVRRRVQSVDNAELWKRQHKGRTVKMPEGSSIFLTAGPWEDYSTPSRDMRLLIAMDAVLNFPRRVLDHPHRFILNAGETPESAEAEMERLIREIGAQRRFDYTRSDGSTWTLSLVDVLDRAKAFEVSYNPNDCPERRWAAPEGSDEYAPCRDNAPEAQRERMESYRSWFAKRERPRKK